MSDDPAPAVTAASGRSFHCFPASVLVFVVNQDHALLLFSRDGDRWAPVAGAMVDLGSRIPAGFMAAGGFEFEAQPRGPLPTAPAFD